MIDADNLKAINDRFGHESGDEALVLVARALRGAVHVGAQSGFVPRGAAHSLSVSVGGIAFSGAETFSELLRLADEQLYVAKQSGRNRTSLVQFNDQFAEHLRRTA